METQSTEVNGQEQPTLPASVLHKATCLESNRRLFRIRDAAFARSQDIPLSMVFPELAQPAMNVTQTSSPSPAPGNGILKGALLAGALMGTGGLAGLALPLIGGLLNKPASVAPEKPGAIVHPQEFDLDLEVKDGKLVPTKVTPVAGK